MPFCWCPTNKNQHPATSSRQHLKPNLHHIPIRILKKYIRRPRHKFALVLYHTSSLQNLVAHHTHLASLPQPKTEMRDASHRTCLLRRPGFKDQDVMTPRCSELKESRIIIHHFHVKDCAIKIPRAGKVNSRHRQVSQTVGQRFAHGGSLLTKIVSFDGNIQWLHAASASHGDRKTVSKPDAKPPPPLPCVSGAFAAGHLTRQVLSARDEQT